MGNPHRNTRLLRSTKRKDRKRVDVTVDNLPALLLKETLKLSLVFSYMLIGRYLKDPATERFDLVTGNKRRIGINKKVKLHFTAIDVTIVIHNDSFDAAANHLANNLSHPNRFSHLASTSTGKDLNDREENNLQVRDEAALGDVLQITADHPVKVGIVAVGHLPPAGDARLHCQALQVVVGVLRNLIRQRRARAHDGHLPQEHVEELRELVDGVLADELADFRYARVVPHLEHGTGDLVLLLELGEALIGVLVHGSELPHAEG